MVKNMLIAFVIALTIKSLFTSYRVNSSSMYPLLSSGDRVLSLNVKYLPIHFQERDIIIFHHQIFSSIFIKRISNAYTEHYDVISENNEGLNSRTLGQVAKNDILAYPLIIYYPITHISIINLWKS